jgi:mono/diheme cytochrome c family protein
MKKTPSNTRFITVALAAALLAGLVSCGKKDENSPGVEFMPDMYRSQSLEYYQIHTVDGDTVYNAKKPVAGTVARGFMPYTISNTAEGYEKAGTDLKNPLAADQREKWEKQGEELYGKFCIHCHGATGAGDGKVALKLPGPPPPYNAGALKTLPEGKIFHSISYGKGLMGPHNSLLTTDERWKLVYYVQKLQGPKNDSTKTATTPAPAAGKGTVTPQS